MNKKLFLVVLISFLFLGFLSPQKAKADTTVSFSIFYSSLSPYGHWVFIQPYGYVWYPVNVEYGWMPYVNGYWIWSDYGWTWVSYEAWGWATYHYGRWIFDGYYGWLWIPGTVWGPAWVVWYRGSDYIGWAPRPPRQRFFSEIGIPEAHYNTYIPPQRCVFVRTNNFLSKHVNTVMIPRFRNAEIIRTTTPITEIKISHGRVFNEGPGRGFVERYTRTKVERFNIVPRNINSEEVVHNPDRINTVQRRVYYVYRPVIIRRAGEAPGTVYMRGREPARTNNRHFEGQPGHRNQQEYIQYQNRGIPERNTPSGPVYNNFEGGGANRRGIGRGRAHNPDNDNN
ncbi:MAG: DUF6600 domain-containing protein [bacterium]